MSYGQIIGLKDTDCHNKETQIGRPHRNSNRTGGKQLICVEPKFNFSIDETRERTTHFVFPKLHLLLFPLLKVFVSVVTLRSSTHHAGGLLYRGPYK